MTSSVLINPLEVKWFLFLVEKWTALQSTVRVQYQLKRLLFLKVKLKKGRAGFQGTN